ncbi:multicopper oxidase domain-containing protein [Ornithinimicrobium faecis]|uniref:Copper-containing nitrite reductase n=1 Tax=Ornithinimicrobium faecis TaxID=2934158 RepID=A0ABY4YZ92_9MICO|nr:multicopper oxidase domain-containing protein [Ornithinimicrobium sp. HY1793]USQ82066.1 multicopper oxidase domain-containing protein [Ornithinimicrobium sp. HY1793]
MNLTPPSPTPPSPSQGAPSPTPRDRGARAQARGIWPLRDHPALLWMLLAVVVALVHQWVPDATWLMVHLVLLGALTHSIFVWSTHFAQALLKTPDALDSRSNQSRRLTLLLVGTAAVMVGVPSTQWWLVVTGAVLVSSAVIWHGLMLRRRLVHALPGRFRITIRYYLFAAVCLPVGAAFGAALALGLSQSWHDRLLVAHMMTNLLGWVGLTVTGTLITLWPTMLRTPMDSRAEALAKQALPILLIALVITDAGALAGLRQVTVSGLVLYAAGLAWWARALWVPARRRPPREFATASVACALGWLAVGIGTTILLVARGQVSDSLGTLASIFVVGFAAQLLPGALSYLMPTALGGGPSVVRAGQKVFNTLAALRLVIINVGLILCLAPVPSLVRVTVSVLVLLALAAFLPVMITSIVTSIRAKRALGGGLPPLDPTARVERPPSALTLAQSVAGTAALLVAITVGVGLDPVAAGLGGGASAVPVASVTPTGETTHVEVSASGMTFTPDTVTVPLGNRLVIDLVNDDPATTHDLTLGGEKTSRLGYGEHEELVIDIVSGPIEGWCTIVGHRQAGMTFSVLTQGAPPVAGEGSDASADHGDDAPADHGSDTQGDHSTVPLLTDDPLPVIQPIDPALQPAPEATTHRVTLTAQEVPLEVAPGIWQQRWTFNGQAPGPTLRGTVGDVFEITLVNDGTMGHSIDFHAGALAPDEPMRTIPPGESLVYRFTAERSGIWMYHCSTMPMSSHIAAGMTGAVIIDPPGLPEVDHELLLVQSEVYLSSVADNAEEATEVSADKIAAEDPDLVVFNGIANQYDEHTLQVATGDRVRIWVLDAGPNRLTSFHVVGGQFDTVYQEGRWLLGGPGGASDADGGSVVDGGSAVDGEGTGGGQALGLMPAQGGFVELVLPEAGHYPLVSHLMIDAERGAHGILEVTD